MNKEKRTFQLDRVALAVSLLGVVLGVIIATVGRLLNEDFATHGYGVFVAFSVAAIVLGILTRTSTIGKPAWITSSILIAWNVGISLQFVHRLYGTRRP